MDDDLSVRSPGFDSLSPADELELADLQVRMAELDEHDTMWSPDEAPRPPNGSEEAVTDREGGRLVDVQRDTTRVDDIAEFDLSAADLRDVDL